jgi:hypothetical protein
MSDIVERLRAEYCSCHEGYKARGLVDPSCESCQTKNERNEAAGEIERLRAERDALKADASRWRFWRCQWPVLTTMRVAQDVGLDLTNFYVSSPEDMDGATDAAIDAARKA